MIFNDDYKTIIDKKQLKQKKTVEKIGRDIVITYRDDTKHRLLYENNYGLDKDLKRLGRY
jgi:hypothetical protein